MARAIYLRETLFLKVQNSKMKKDFFFKWRSQYNTDLRCSRGQISRNGGGNWETV